VQIVQVTNTHQLQVQGLSENAAASEPTPSAQAPDHVSPVQNAAANGWEQRAAAYTTPQMVEHTQEQQTIRNLLALIAQASTRSASVSGRPATESIPLPAASSGTVSTMASSLGTLISPHQKVYSSIREMYDEYARQHPDAPHEGHVDDDWDAFTRGFSAGLKNPLGEVLQFGGQLFNVSPQMQEKLRDVGDNPIGHALVSAASPALAQLGLSDKALNSMQAKLMDLGRFAENVVPAWGQVRRFVSAVGKALNGEALLTEEVHNLIQDMSKPDVTPSTQHHAPKQYGDDSSSSSSNSALKPPPRNTGETKNVPAFQDTDVPVQPDESSVRPYIDRSVSLKGIDPDANGIYQVEGKRYLQVDGETFRFGGTVTDAYGQRRALLVDQHEQAVTGPVIVPGENGQWHKLGRKGGGKDGPGGATPNPGSRGKDMADADLASRRHALEWRTIAAYDAEYDRLTRLIRDAEGEDPQFLLDMLADPLVDPAQDPLFDALLGPNALRDNLIEARSNVAGKFLKAARTYLAQFEEPTLPVTLDIPEDAHPDDFFRLAYEKSNGVAIGENHNDPAAQRYVFDNLDYLQQLGVRKLYLEQDVGDLVLYKDDGSATTLLEELERRGLEAVNLESGLSSGVETFLADSFTRAGPDEQITTTLEEDDDRMASFNYYAKHKIDEDLKQRPDQKYLILTGAAHMSRHVDAGDVSAGKTLNTYPGMAELFHIPAVEVYEGAQDGVGRDERSGHLKISIAKGGDSGDSGSADSSSSADESSEA
jgi:hypothetical protein